MKNAFLSLGLGLFLCLGGTAFAAKISAVESHGDFFKIVEGDKPIGAPTDRDAPDILYIRKTSIVRVSVVFATRSADYKVLVVTSGPAATSRFDDDRLTVVSDTKTYLYTFPTEATATAFSEALIGAKG